MYVNGLVLTGHNMQILHIGNIMFDVKPSENISNGRYFLNFPAVPDNINVDISYYNDNTRIQFDPIKIPYKNRKCNF